MLQQEELLNDNNRIINQISRMITEDRFDDALELNIRIYEEALANDQHRLTAYCLYYFGLIEEKANNPQKAMNFYKKSTHYCRKYGIFDCLVQVLNNRGNLYGFSGKYPNAMSKYMEALTIVEKNPQILGYRERILNNVGLLYLDIGELDKALDYFHKCVEIAKQGENQLLLATVYSNLCEIYIRKEVYLKAKYYNNISRQISFQIEDQIGIALTIAYHAIIDYREKGNFEHTKALFEKSIEVITSKGEEVEEYEIRLLYGTEAFHAGRLVLAKRILSDLAVKLEEKAYAAMEVNALNVLKKISVREEDYHTAYRYADRILDIQESMSRQWKSVSLEQIDRDKKDANELAQVDEMQQSIKILKELSVLGQKITACTEKENVFKILVEQAKLLFSYSAFGMGIKNPLKGTISYEYYDHDQYGTVEISAYEERYLMVQCIRSGSDIIIYDTQDEEENLINLPKTLYDTIRKSNNRALIFCPIKYEGEAIGGITIQSEKKGSFSYMHLESLRVLSSYVAIALTNLERAKELLEANRKLEEYSLVDSLTKTFNRHALSQYIAKDFQDLIRTNLPAAALMIDIDFFKQYNDNYGHVKGDKCLQRIAARLKETMANYTYRLFRYGGDEFFAILENIDETSCSGLLEEIKDEMQRLNIEHEYSKAAKHVSLTIGAAIITKTVADYTHVFTAADEALYVAKDRGKNTYHIVVMK